MIKLRKPLLESNHVGTTTTLDDSSSKMKRNRNGEYMSSYIQETPNAAQKSLNIQIAQLLLLAEDNIRTNSFETAANIIRQIDDLNESSRIYKSVYYWKLKILVISYNDKSRAVYDSLYSIMSYYIDHLSLDFNILIECLNKAFDASTYERNCISPISKVGENTIHIISPILQASPTNKYNVYKSDNKQNNNNNKLNVPNNKNDDNNNIMMSPSDVIGPRLSIESRSAVHNLEGAFDDEDLFDENEDLNILGAMSSISDISYQRQLSKSGSFSSTSVTSKLDLQMNEALSNIELAESKLLTPPPKRIRCNEYI